MATAREAGLPGISSFANGLEQDLHAVTQGLAMSWSPGPVEGRVNHIKMVSARCSAGPTCRCSASASCSPPGTDHRHAAARQEERLQVLR